VVANFYFLLFNSQLQQSTSPHYSVTFAITFATITHSATSHHHWNTTKTKAHGN